MNTKNEHDTKKIVSCARAILTHQIGLPVGCQKMSRLFFWSSDFDSSPFHVFNDYLKQIEGLPIGTERLNWNREALKPFDQKLSNAENIYREKITDACFKIIELYKSGTT